MAKLKSVQEEWQGFSEMVFHKTPAGEIQKQEMKKAFFAGAWAMFCAIQEIGSDYVSEQEGFKFLEERKKELETFYRNLIAEYAKSN